MESSQRKKGLIQAKGESEVNCFQVKESKGLFKLRMNECAVMESSQRKKGLIQAKGESEVNCFQVKERKCFFKLRMKME